MTSISFENTILMPIDMQQGFDMGERWPRRWNGACKTNGSALLTAWRGAGLPVIHVKHDSSDPKSTLQPGQTGNEFWDEFQPSGTEITVGKNVNSAFIGTNLDELLREMDVQHIIIFGISTDQCVSTTIRTGANMGWRFTLIEDACDCFDLPARDGTTIAAQQIHAAHIATLEFEFCDVDVTQNLLAQLTS